MDEARMIGTYQGVVFHETEEPLTAWVTQRQFNDLMRLTMTRETKAQLRERVDQLWDQLKGARAKLEEMTLQYAEENALRVKADEVNRQLARSMAEERSKYAVAVTRMQRVIAVVFGQLSDTSDVKVNISVQTKSTDDDVDAMKHAVRSSALPLSQFPWGR